MAAHDKRSFLHRAFHPHGTSVCRAVGMFPASSEVETAETAINGKALRSLRISQDDWAMIYERAKWMSEAISAGSRYRPYDEPEDGDWRVRPLELDFMAFHVALLLESSERSTRSLKT